MNRQAKSDGMTGRTSRTPIAEAEGDSKAERFGASGRKDLVSRLLAGESAGMAREALKFVKPTRPTFVWVENFVEDSRSGWNYEQWRRNQWGSRGKSPYDKRLPTSHGSHPIQRPS